MEGLGVGDGGEGAGGGGGGGCKKEIENWTRNRSVVKDYQSFTRTASGHRKRRKHVKVVWMNGPPRNSLALEPSQIPPRGSVTLTPQTPRTYFLARLSQTLKSSSVTRRVQIVVFTAPPPPPLSLSLSVSVGLFFTLLCPYETLLRREHDLYWVLHKSTAIIITTQVNCLLTGHYSIKWKKQHKNVTACVSVTVSFHLRSFAASNRG